MKKKLDELIITEINSYDVYLNSCVSESKEFEYLEHLANRYEAPVSAVIDHNFDVFNWYMKNGVDEHQSKVMSLYLTHEHIMRVYYNG